MATRLVPYLATVSSVFGLLLATAASAQVQIIGSWTTGLSHTAESGSSRILVFTAHHQDNDSAGSYLTSVTYGGQPMTPIAESEYYVDPYHYYVAAYVLNDAGIAAASDGNFAVTWSDGGPSNTPGYSSVFLENVDQTSPIGASAIANCDCDILSTAALANNAGDMVMLAATNGGNSASSTGYDCLNGFTKALEFYDPPNSGEAVCGYKPATGADETPSVNGYNTDYSGRQALLGFVVQVEAAQPCGNGGPDPGEECDDGNTLDGDCCSSTCQYEPTGSPCGDTGDTLCDNPDSCNGTGRCLANYEPLWTECRADTGECDVVEYCDGLGTCPNDDHEPPGTPCGDPSDTVCDDPDTCDGAGTCLPNYEPPTTVCRPDAGDCDVAAELCDGAGNCPDDVFEDAGTPCDDLNTCTLTQECDGAGTCAGVTFATLGTGCGDPGDTDCDNPDTCDEAGTCLANHEPTTTPCGDPNDADCDNPDSCDGTGLCSDNREPPTFACRPAMNICDPAEFCDGVNDDCPPDVWSPTTTVCRAAAHQCDVAEYCMITTAPSCPPDDLAPEGTPCNDENICTVVDECDAAGTCTSDIYEPENTPCDDHDPRTNDERCDAAGICWSPSAKVPALSLWGQLLLGFFVVASGSGLVVQRRRKNH